MAVTKSDPNYLQSNNHPDLTNGKPPRTDSASISTILMREDSNCDRDNASGQRPRKRMKKRDKHRYKYQPSNKRMKVRQTLQNL